MVKIRTFLQLYAISEEKMQNRTKRTYYLGVSSEIFLPSSEGFYIWNMPHLPP